MLDVVERARRYIAKCPPAISGQGGHDAAFHVAALLVHGFALGDGDAMTLMWEFNTRCQPPWTERELRHKLASAVRAQHAQPPGYLLGEGTNGTKGTATPKRTSTPHPSPLRFMRGHVGEGIDGAGGEQVFERGAKQLQRVIPGLGGDAACRLGVHEGADQRAVDVGHFFRLGVLALDERNKLPQRGLALRRIVARSHPAPATITRP